MLRRGVSLMEVLFSIGIVSIGLLGVFAIYPLALNQLGRGVVSDRSTRAGTNAIDTFSAQGMNRPDLWMWYTGSQTVPSYATSFVSNASLLPDGSNTGLLIDPQFIAANRGTRSANVDARLFPYYPRAVTGQPRLRRITLANLFSSTAGTPSVMTGAEAATIFMAADDLVFDLPEDRNATPEQVFGAATTRRQFEGTISWMATLVPELDVSTSASVPGELYRLSIIMFHHRNPTMAMDGQTERIATVTSFYNAGISGGDVELGAPNADSLDLKRGDWLMLAATAYPRAAGNTDADSLFKWYRVVETEDDVRVVSGSSRRDVTLAGPDWPAAYLTNSPSGTPPGLGVTTYAFLVSDVVAVFERTINLETSSLWTY